MAKHFETALNSKKLDFVINIKIEVWECSGCRDSSKNVEELGRESTKRSL